MKDSRGIVITVGRSQEPGRYVARYEAQLLQATFSVEVPDSIFGALALHAFAGMIETHYGGEHNRAGVGFLFSGDCLPPQSKPLQDVVKKMQDFVA